MSKETQHGEKPTGEPARGLSRRRRGAEHALRIGSKVLLWCMLLGSSAVFFAAGTWMTLKFTVQVPEVKLPKLVGNDLIAAESQLRALGLVPQITGHRFDAELPAGRVLEQFPPRGARTKAGRPVRLVISQGAERALVPELKGSSLRRAQLALRAVGLRVEQSSSAPSSIVGLGRVMAQNPAPGSEGYPGDGVSLLLSAGPAERAFVMPTLVGWQERAAKKLMRKAGVRRLSSTHEVRGSERIVSHQPAPGSRVGPDDRVLLEPGPVFLSRAETP